VTGVQTCALPIYLTAGPYWIKEFETRWKGKVRYAAGCWAKTDLLLDLKRQRGLLREQFCQAQRLDPALPLIAYFPSYIGGGHGVRQVRDVRLLHKFLPREVSLLMFKHQMEHKDTLKFWEHSRGAILKHGIIKQQAMAAADVIISDTSSMAYEALVFDVPIVLIDNPKDPAYLHVRHKLKYPRLDFGEVCTIQELGAAVTRCLRQPGRLAEKRRHWRDWILGPVDGKCAQRAVTAIENEGARWRREGEQP
jgi:CDP-glycerol glycerophosphotransferase (TagB/SpsB family)